MGVPLMRTKTWAYALRRVLRGHRRRLLRGLQELDLPAGLLLQHLGLHPLHGHPRRHGEHLGRDPRRAFLSYLDREGLANTGAWVNSNLGPHIDVPKYEFGIYGVLIIVIVMLLRPQGLIPSARRKRELELGTHDEPAYDVAH